jgi:putative NADH-flavin reductase
MKIVVFGASGRVGRIVVTKLLEKGHDVTAFVHSSKNLPEHSRLKLVQGDIHDSTQVAAAIQGNEVVMSTLGSWGTKSKDIVSTGMKSIVPAMEAQGISRIISLTGTEAWLDDEEHTVLQKVSHLVFSRIARGIIRDGEEHLRLLQQSNTNWTALRSPRMRGKGLAGKYLVSLQPPKPWAAAHRDDVADAMIEQLEESAFHHSAPYISSIG